MPLLPKMARSFRSSFVRLMFAGFLALSVLILAAGMIISVVGVDQARSQVVDSYGTSIQVVANALRDQLSDAEALASISLLEDELIRLCASGNTAPDLYGYVRFGDSLALRVNNRTLDVRLTILMPGENWAISTAYGVRRTKELGMDEEYYALMEKKAQWHVAPRLGSELDPPDRKEESPQSLTIVEGFLRRKQKSPCILIEIPEKSLMKALTDATAGMDVVSIFFSDGQGGFLQTGEKLEAIQDFQSNKRIKTVSGRSFPCVLVENGSFQVGVLFDDSKLLRPVVLLRKWILILFSLCLAACAAFALLNYSRVVRPVQELVSSMDKASSGDLSGRVALRHHDEFGRIARHYNRMLEQIQQLIQEQYVKQLQLQRAQLRFLRLQIRPHFLYNCLFSLYTMIKNEDLDNAANMAVYLGRYYQMSTRMEESEIPLAQELENVRMYISINQMRFSGKLEYEADIAPELTAFPLPALLLLTLIENVINHGLKSPMERTLIRVEAQPTADGLVCLRVLDTGCGMDEEKRQALLQELKREEFDENAHGLVNVMLRLRMIYGRKVRIAMEPNTPSGTIVTLLIPQKHKEENGV